MMNYYKIQDLNAQKSLARIAREKQIITKNEYAIKIKELDVIEKNLIDDNRIRIEQLNSVKKNLKKLVLA